MSVVDRTGAWRRRLLLFAGMVWLAGCTGSARPPEPPGAAARRALVIQAEDGLVRAEVAGRPSRISDRDVERFTLDEFARAIPALDVRFTTDPAGAVAIEPHLVIVYDPAPATPGAAACTEPGALPLAPSPDRVAVLAAYCDGDEVIGLVRDQAEVDSRRDVQRLLWSAARRLFPDDYASNYGINVLPPGLGVGVGGSFGF